MLCDLNCKNLKCIATGECTDIEPLPFAESPSLVPHDPCGCMLASCREAPDCRLGRGPSGHSNYTPVTPKAGTVRQRIIDAPSDVRKTYPMAAGLLDYFPDALAEVSKISYLGNQKHNPGEPMHHARGKSMDHADCIIRHLVGRGGFDGELRESAALAWRALALLQEELEREMNLPLPRGARA